MKSELSPEEETESAALEQHVAVESLVILYRGSLSAAVAHVVPASLVFYTLTPAIEFDTLLYWWLAITAAAGARLVLSSLFKLQRSGIDDDPDADIRHALNSQTETDSSHGWSTSQTRFWSRLLTLQALIQTGLWGAAALLLWPEDIAERGILVLVLAGIIAVGGIMFAVHRKSLWIYSLPVAVPTVYMLLSTGSRPDYTMAALVVLYSMLLPVGVNHLTRKFRAGIRSRFRLHALSITDPLTELANKRGFDEFLHDVWQQSIRSLRPLSLLIIDVDQFKEFNDQYGHPRGDEALQQLAAILRDVASRSTDLCARVGGEEFVILMAATGESGSMQVAREIQERLQRENIIHEANSAGRVTVSIGIRTQVPSRDLTVEAFVEAADRALYSAKALGRNRIEIHRE